MNSITSLIISAPSGGGKGECVRYIKELYPEKFTLSVSATTRAMSATESHGREYYFLSPEEFKTKIADDELLEYEEVYQDRFYGTLRSEVDRARQEGKIIIFEVDIKGAITIKNKLGDDAVFLWVDSGNDVSVYERRIRKRARTSDTETEIQKRISKVPAELAEGRSHADDIIDNQGTLEEYHADIKRAVEQNGVI